MSYLIYKRIGGMANHVVAQIWTEQAPLANGVLDYCIQKDEIATEYLGKTLLQLTLIYPYRSEPDLKPEKKPLSKDGPT